SSPGNPDRKRRKPEHPPAATRGSRVAAPKGYPPGQHSPAEAYALGVGVKQDYVEAARLYRQAAEQGFTPSQMALAGMYLRGEGVPRSRDEADRWMQRAADAGDPRAREALDSTPLSR